MPITIRSLQQLHPIARWQFWSDNSVATTSTQQSPVSYPTGTSAANLTDWRMMMTSFASPSTSLYYHAIPTSSHWSELWTPALYPPTIRHARPAARILARPALLRGRRALRRSIELFRRLRPEEELRTFLSGRPLLVHGVRFDYRVQKRDDLLHHTMNPNTAHIPYDLRLIDKGNGAEIARGCVVIRDTPVIDQLLALILHAQDPDREGSLLAKTNWTPRWQHMMAA